MVIGLGSRVGPYEITALIGEGGMGKVWRARHVELERDDALKVLPETFADDPDRVARFRREAQVLASLNHPNIAHLYGLETAGSARALVMELVEGPTLADRLGRGPLPLGETLRIGKQIAEALEAAHEQGIVHRDLKPANIKVREDGTVKVLDFGLAKLVETNSPSSPGGDGPHSQSPTITSPVAMTGVGMLLGTAAYMAPEQAHGKPVDKRTDIWAFGCVLFEMLTGCRAFDGEDATDALAAVLRGEPDWSVLPADTPPSIRVLLRSCLEKDRHDRIADMAAAVFVIKDHAALSAPPQIGKGAVPLTNWRRTVALTAAGVLIGAAVAGPAMWLAMRPSPPRIVRSTVATSSGTLLGIVGPRTVAVTPDGLRVVYRDGGQLFVRALAELEAEPVAVIQGASGLGSVSPDGQWILYSDGNVLKKVAVTGGPAVTVMATDGPLRGMTWSPDSTTIVFATSASTGLQRVSANGGEVATLTTTDRDRGEANHLWPEFLPDGRAVLFTIAAQAGGLDAAQIALLDLQTGNRTVLLRGGSDGRYLPSGHLIYAASGSMRAAPFDLRRRAVTGTSVPVLDPVMVTGSGALNVDVATNGTLVYLSAPDVSEARSLVWVDRKGGEIRLNVPPRAYVYPRISPDGKRVVVSAADEDWDLWVFDIARPTLTRLTFDPAHDITPVWTLDSHAVIFGSLREGRRNLFKVSADGVGPARRLTESRNTQSATGVTPDGRVVMFEQMPSGTRNLKLVTIADPIQTQTLLDTPVDERGGTVSHDGRWLAYESNSSGRYEVYVRPFPEVNDGIWRISTDGGTQPAWVPTGREIVYRGPDGALMAVPVAPTGKVWSHGTPHAIIKGPYFTGPVTRAYDVSADGERFLMVKPDSSPSAAQVIAVQNWFEELKRLVPAK